MKKNFTMLACLFFASPALAQAQFNTTEGLVEHLTEVHSGFFDRIDENMDGTITYGEFKKMATYVDATENMPGDKPIDVPKLFASYDKDGNGKISKQEYGVNKSPFSNLE